MNERLKRAMKIASSLPSDEQEELGAAMLALMGAENDDEPIRLTADERNAIALSRQSADRGEFVSDAEIEALWKKHS
jgi:hypothetical protein